MKITKRYSGDEEKVIVTGVQVRQDSLNDQLKDLVVLADAVGCYDASDFIRSTIKEPNTEAKRIPFCCKCNEKMTQLNLLDKSEQLAGCKKLTKQEWNKGWKADTDGLAYQHNCPLFK